MRTHLRLLGLILAIVSTVMAVGGCSGAARSTRSFCATLTSKNAQIKSTYASQLQAQSAQGSLLTLVTATQALGDLKTMVHELNRKAPDEIKGDMQTVSDNFDSSTKFPGFGTNAIISSLASAFVDALMSSGAYGRVDAFAKSNCGMGLFGN